MPAVFGDFLAAAAEHLEAAVVVSDGQVTQLPEIVRELHHLVAVMSHCLDDLTPYDEIEVSGRTDLHAWERVIIDADAALHTAADHLRQVAEQSSGHADPAASWRARHLAGAATQLTAGRDLLHSHLATGLNGVTRGRSEWALVVTSLPVTRALASEIARWSGQLAPFTAWLAGSAMTHSPRLMPGQATAAAIYDGLASASQWLQVASTAVLPAVHADPVPAADTHLLRAIPAAAVPQRLRPGAAEESVTDRCHGIAVSAARLRAAVRSSPERAAWSPSVTSGGWQWMAQAAAITSHLCELALRSLAIRASQLSVSPAAAAQLDNAADRLVPMRVAWRHVDHSWDNLITESRLLETPVMTEASDLLLRIGRLVWDSPHWTPARADRAPQRLPAMLAPGTDAINDVLAAAHQAVDAISCVAMADLKAVAAADRAGRLYVPTRLLSDKANVPRRFATAPLAQFRTLQNAYRAALDASAGARLALDDIAVAARAPSMTLALARAAAAVQSRRRSWPYNDTLIDLPPHHSPFRNSRASTGGAGPLERAIKDQQVSDPVIVMRAVAIDNAAERLIEQADTAASPTSTPERRENWQRAVRRAALLADESFPHGPVTRLPADTQPALPATQSTVSRTSSPGRHSGRRS